MSLSAGIRVNQYEILAQIGAGGMGEVYRAKDTTLKREVALKVLPDAFAHDSARMAASSEKPRCWHRSTIPKSAQFMA